MMSDIRESIEEKAIASKVIKIVLLSVIITLISNTFLSDGLFSESLNSIIKYQATATSGSIFFMNMVSAMADTTFMSLVLASLFLFYKIRIRAMVFISFFILNIYCMTILKALYHEARPFWYAQNIKQLQWTCPREYGNPSGHSWSVAILYESLLTDFFYCQSKISVTLKWIFLLAIFILVPFSRMYLGAHSGNQVFFGLLMGISMTVLYRFSIQKHLYNLFQYLIRKSVDSGKLKAFVLILFTQILIVVIPMIIYIKAPTQDFQYIQVLNQKCPKHITTSVGLNGSILFTSILISFLFGLIYGILNSFPSTRLYLYGKYQLSTKRSNLKTRILKLLLQIVVVVTPLIVVLIIKYTVQITILKYYICSLFMTISGYVFMKYSDQVLEKYQIVKIQQEQNLL